MIAWIKRNKPELCTDGRPDARRLAEQYGKEASYWYGVLGKEKHRTFGDKAARQIEALLGMPPLHLEGAGWPFEEVEEERYQRLTPLQKGRVQKAMLDEIAIIERQQALKGNGV